MSNINYAALTSQIQSPCKLCDRVLEDKTECMDECEVIKEFRKVLDDYFRFSYGKIDSEDSYILGVYDSFYTENSALSYLKEATGT